MSKKSEPLFDVVIYNVSTNVVRAVIGESLPMWNGTGSSARTVDSRMQLGMAHINEGYDVMSIPAGKHKEGEVILP